MTQQALSYAMYGVFAAALPQQRSKGGPIAPDSNAPTTVSSRGATIPVLIGKRRIGAVFAWAGDRQMGGVQSGGGGGGKGGGGGHAAAPTGPPVYTEAGLHLLCIGPAKKLHNIWSNGKLIFSGTIDAATSPSGSQFDCSDGSGSFRIYWGEFNQAADTDLGVQFGVPTSFPHVCYVYWIRKELGNSPRWPLIEYELETVVTQSALVSTSPTITGTGFTGPNPAHAIYQLLFGLYPLGAGQATTYFDIPGLETLGTTLNTEKLACSILAQDGEDVGSVLTRLLADCGVALAWDPDVGKNRFKAIRAPETPITVTDAQVCDPQPQIEITHGERVADRVVYTFPDRTKFYRNMAINVDDDGQATYVTAQRARQEQISTAVELKVATKIGHRRSQEILGAGPRFIMKGHFGARLFYPGNLIKHASWPLPVRVTEVGLSPNAKEVTITGIGDNYATGATTFEGPDTSSAVGPVSQPATEDLAFRGVEIPAHAQPFPGVVGLWVPRLRAEKWIGFANVHFSRDGSAAYAYEGTDFGFHNGGQLLDPIAATDDWEIAQGPTFTLESIPDDLSFAPDLSAAPDENAWRAGRLMAAINDELFFVGKVTAISGSTYRLDKLIRARYDTDRGTHAIGDDVFLFTDSAQRYYDGAFLQPAQSVFIKTQPVSPSETADLAAMTAQTLTLEGKNVRPMPVSALRTVNASPSYLMGEDIDFAWAYSTWGNRSAGAGLGDAGTPVAFSPPENSFVVRIYTSDFVTLKRTEFVNDPEFTYTNANLVADFGSEVSFGIDVRGFAGLESRERRLVVSKV